jgi:hypothetical protein
VAQAYLAGRTTSTSDASPDRAASVSDSVSLAGADGVSSSRAASISPAGADAASVSLARADAASVSLTRAASTSQDRAASVSPSRAASASPSRAASVSSALPAHAASVSRRPAASNTACPPPTSSASPDRAAADTAETTPVRSYKRHCTDTIPAAEAEWQQTDRTAATSSSSSSSWSSSWSNGAEINDEQTSRPNPPDGNCYHDNGYHDNEYDEHAATSTVPVPVPQPLSNTELIRKMKDLPVECRQKIFKIFEHLPHRTSLAPSPPSISSFAHNPYNKFPPTDYRAYVKVPGGPAAAANAFDVGVLDAFLGDDSCAGIQFGFGGDDKAAQVREQERAEELANEIRTPLDAILDGLFVVGSPPLGAESLFSSEHVVVGDGTIPAETLQGLVQTEFKPYIFKGEVAYVKNHREFHGVIRRNNKSKQDDAHSKLSHELCNGGLDKLLHDSTDVRVKVKVGGQYVSASATYAALFYFYTALPLCTYSTCT